VETSGLKFAKPKHKKKPNHSRRNKTRSKAAMIRDLDKSARVDVVESRDKNVCQWCCKKAGDWDPELKRPVRIQWCHVHTRRWLCVRWDEDNSFAGCDRCHNRFDNNKVLGFDWFAKKFPERWERLVRFLQSGETKTSDARVRELWEARGK
jgi:hypothetical protein